MNKQNTEKLLKDFPSLYKQYYLPMEQTCMCWGFEVDDGWFNIIYKLSTDLMKVNSECEACQVKEKFGGLRFYTDNLNEEGHKLIEWAEKMSFSICEVCGSPGKLYTEKWYKTLCEKCKEKDGKKKSRM